MENARRKLEKGQKKPVSQKMFKVVYKNIKCSLSQKWLVRVYGCIQKCQDAV